MKIRIEEVQRELSKLRKEGVARSFIAIRSIRSDEAVIEANVEGLVALADALVTLAVSGKEGSHFNFDTATGAHVADLDIVFARVLAPWDKS